MKRPCPDTALHAVQATAAPPAPAACTSLVLLASAGSQPLAIAIGGDGSTDEFSEVFL